ncbi:MAG: alcohol dehydrogenase catalytic domain-containing protein [Nitriliruptoraceae bacterium]
MSDATFTALLLERSGDGPVRAGVTDLPVDRLPGGDGPADGEVEVAVTHSSLNYKDALIVTGTGGPLVREHPHVPGIDLAGTVVAVGSGVDPGTAAVGDEVLVTGCWLGERRWGGMATRARVPAAGLVRRPAGDDDALAHGGGARGDGTVLVTGATGGVGSLAVHLLTRTGHTVAAATGSPDAAAVLEELGAPEIVPRSELEALAAKPLASARWAGVVDVAGGPVLAGALVSTAPRGVVVACGIAGGRRLDVDLAPFFARGVVLAGIDSVLHPMAERPAIWARLAAGADPAVLDRIATTVGLGGVHEAAEALLSRGGRGRAVVAVG